jgi:hypothetical protein
MYEHRCIKECPPPRLSQSGYVLAHAAWHDSCQIITLGCNSRTKAQPEACGGPHPTVGFWCACCCTGPLLQLALYPLDAWPQLQAADTRQFKQQQQRISIRLTGIRIKRKSKPVAGCVLMTHTSADAAAIVTSTMQLGATVSDTQQDRTNSWFQSQAAAATTAVAESEGPSQSLLPDACYTQRASCPSSTPEPLHIQLLRR